MANKPDGPQNALVSVIIPARNEVDTIARVITRVGALDGVAEVVVADNGSDDGTKEAAQAAGALVVREDRPGAWRAQCVVDV